MEAIPMKNRSRSNSIVTIKMGGAAYAVLPERAYRELWMLRFGKKTKITKR